MQLLCPGIVVNLKDVKVIFKTLSMFSIQKLVFIEKCHF